jgi:transcriptional regulator with XRE-family HTH domain
MSLDFEALMAASNSKQLGEFLRRRRERLNPRDCGLPASARRRTPGLRREEVAERSGISVDWYIRLEQGRDTLPSRATAEALSKALKLGPADRAHLIRLASPAARRTFIKEAPPANLIALVEGLNTPACLIGARFDLLCWNRKAVELFRDYSKIPEPRRNTLYQMFTAPEMKERYPEWEREARGLLESFRATFDFWSDAPEFVALVEELKSLSPEFRRWWREHGIRLQPSGEKLMRHPKRGLIRMSYATFQCNDNPDLRLVAYGEPVRVRV